MSEGGARVTIAPEILRKRVSDDYGPLERLRHQFGAIAANKLPRRFRWLPVLSWVARATVACSPPGLAFFYGNIGLGLAIGGASLLLLGALLSEFLGQLERARSRSKTDHSMIARVGEVFNSTKASVIKQQGAVETAIAALLGIVEACCRTVTKSDENEISVTLLQYVNEGSTSEVLIRRREPGNKRPVGSFVSTEGLVGHYACQADADRPHVVHQLRDFGDAAMVSPSQSQVNYKSIFIIPLQIRKNGKREIKGFVSVDSVRPYSFYGNRGREIAVYCRPVVNLLTQLL